MHGMRLHHRNVPLRRLGGWTFVETLIVIGIILILTSAVGFMAFKYIDQAKQATAKSQIETFALALSSYYIDCKSYPDPSQGLTPLWEKPAGVDGWNGPYIAKAVPKDPWPRLCAESPWTQWASVRDRQPGAHGSRGRIWRQCVDLVGKIGWTPTEWSTPSSAFSFWPWWLGRWQQRSRPWRGWTIFKTTESTKW